MPNLKHLSLFFFFFMLARERIFIKMHSTESRCVTGLENILFLNGVHAAVSPGILPAGAVKGLKTQEYNVWLLPHVK